jgi:Rrf2 family protein
MKLTTRGQYGLLAMYDLARHDRAPVSIKAISQRQGISDAYLEQLMASLKKAGLVRSTRGAQGGYQLAKNPMETSIGEILLALEGSLTITDCVDNPRCDDPVRCPSRPVFARIQNSIDEVLNTITLQDMLNGVANPEEMESVADDRACQAGKCVAREKTV